MKVLIAPLNWGLGHATRCIPLIRKYIDEGHEVLLGGDGQSLTRLMQEFPSLPYVSLSPLHLHYAKGTSQVWALLRALPQFISMYYGDRRILQQLIKQEHIDMVISDNRFGLFNHQVTCIYLTHQLYIHLPRTMRFFEQLAFQVHRRIWQHYNQVWVPDYEDETKCLSGALSHSDYPLPSKVQFIGPLSRLQPTEQIDKRYDVVALLSGIEPQRSLLEEQICREWYGKQQKVLIVQGRVSEPFVEWHRGNLTIVPHLADTQLTAVLQGTQTILCRSGYSTIMDLATLNLLQKAKFIPTPGQSEQEYLAAFLAKRQKQ